MVFYTSNRENKQKKQKKNGIDFLFLLLTSLCFNVLLLVLRLDPPAVQYVLAER